MKRHISLAAVFTALFMAVFASSALAAFSDVSQDNRYYEAITTLSKLESAGPVESGSATILNGYEDGTFKPEGNITRAEFTKIVAYTMGIQGLKVEPTEFTDVSDHWAKYNIKAAYDSGIINGMGDGTFAPDANVTYDQALKMVVCMLNHGALAEMEGGYPGGYRSQASKLKLTTGVENTGFSDAATRGMIAQIMYNALEVDMREVINSSEEEKTLLKDYLKVKKLKGILVGVEDYKTGDCTEKLNLKELDVLGSKNEGEVVLNYTNYKNAAGNAATVTDINKYLGKIITVYYQQAREIDTPMLMIIDDENTNNTEYDISYKNITSLKDDTLTYYVGENSSNSKKLRFSKDDLNIRYNGKVVDRSRTYTVEEIYLDENGIISTRTDTLTYDEAIKEWLDPDSDYFIYGNVVLTDRDSDGYINDVQINDYDEMVVYRKPVISDYRVTDKLIAGNYITLDPDAGDYTFTIVKNGTQINTTDLNADDILLYAKSLDGEMLTCEVGSTSVQGKVTSLDENDMEIYIDNKLYNLGDMCKMYISTNQDGKVLASGQTGTFYVDKFNTVVYGVISDEKANPYAYVTNSYASEDGSSFYLSLFIPSKATSGSVNYKLKDKVNVNGERMSDGEAIAFLNNLAKDEIEDSETYYYSNNDINSASNKSKIYGTSSTKLANGNQPIRVELNASDEISSIVTITNDAAAYDGTGATALTTNEDTSKIVRCKDLTQYNYTSSSFTLSNKTQFQVNSNSTIIYVPGDRTDKPSYAKKATSSFTSTEKYYVEAYDINSSKVAGLVILYGQTGSNTDVTKATDYSIVSERPQTVYDENEGEDKLSFSVFAGTSSTARKWTAKNSSEFSDLEAGDVLLFGYDQDKYAQDRIDVIRFADIDEILEGKEVSVADKTIVTEDEEEEIAVGGTHEEIYNWTEAPDDDDTVQTQKFNYRYPKSGTGKTPFYETYTSATLGTIPYSRACMFNVYQIQEENNKLLVTQGGFASYGGIADNVLYDTDNYEEITISSSTRIIRMDRDARVKFSTTVEGTDTTLTYRDLKAAQNYGSDCSKILVCQRAGVARLIVVFE